MFWGQKIKPKKPVVLEDFDGRRLHVSQATLGPKANDKRCIIKCHTLGEENEIVICSLKSGLNETCSLDLFFEEPVVFSVSGSAVYLSGYYDLDDDDDDDDDYESDMDDQDREFIVDDESEDLEGEDIDTPRSNVKIVEISGEDAEPKKAVPEPAEKKAETSEEESDEDGLPVSTPSNKRKNAAKQSDEPASKKTKPAASVEAATPESSKKKKKKDKKQKAEVTVPVPAPEEKKSQEKLSKSAKKRKSFPNGLEIQDVEMGKPDGKPAQAGKKVSIHYTGKLKSTGKVFDSTVGKRPFQFRLGVNEVVKGFDIGVMGMRLGDKRRVTIPPEMGYGSKAVGSIPPGSWLVFDIELVDVKG